MHREIAGRSADRRDIMIDFVQLDLLMLCSSSATPNPKDAELFDLPSVPAGRFSSRRGGEDDSDPPPTDD